MNRSEGIWAGAAQREDVELVLDLVGVYRSEGIWAGSTHREGA